MANYQTEWQKAHMKQLNLRYSSDFVQEFSDACRILEKSKSEVIRSAMQRAIRSAERKQKKEATKI